MASYNQPNGGRPTFMATSSDSPHPAHQETYSEASNPFSIPPRLMSSGPNNVADHLHHPSRLTQGRPRSNLAANSPAPAAPASFYPKYNAAALLNPRATPRTQHNEDRGGKAAIQVSHASSPVFEFESPATQLGFVRYANNNNSYLGNSVTHEAQNAPMGNGMGTPVGMGHMLERVHNVTERDFLPQKRRKLQNEEDLENAKKPVFRGGGKGGVLGEYMKEKQEEGRKEAAANSSGSAVDLTGADDEEISIVDNFLDKEVCYGRIEGADINACRVPTPKEGSKALSSGFWPQVKIILKRRVGDRTSIVNVVDSTRTVIGCLDVNTSIGLVPILDSKLGVRTSARILTRPKKDGDPPPGSEVSCRFNLDLTLYGPRKHALQIGKHLSHKQLWLRNPMFVEAGIETFNPHSIQNPYPVARPGRCTTSYGSGSAMQRTVEEIRSDVLGMFDSLEKSENLPEMEPSPQIITDLLSHQKQGLYFMTNKEKERVFGDDEADNSSLWRLRIGSNGQKSYYNVITGQEERENPPQVLGGILADMMGLGKTLSILSLIIGSLGESKEWAKKSPPRPGSDELPLKLNAKTTLLISPLSTIVNWEEQIAQHVAPGTLKYHIYHGTNRIRDVRKLADFDLIITTYGSVASELNKRSKGKEGACPLEEINWFRIVLDEAHMIREQATLQSKATCRLQAQRRWAVTGTPVQNRLDDLGALIKFLRVKPFDDKRGFTQFILAPCKNADPEILPKLRLLVDSFTLRRLKDRINLPARHDSLVRLNFSPDEQKLYDIFAKNAVDRVAVLTNQREKVLGGKAYVHILQSILRLRLICAHGKELLSEDDLKITAGISKASAIDLDSDEEYDKPALTSKQAYDMYNLMKETNADSCTTCNAKMGPNDIGDSDGEAKDEIIGHMTPCYHLLCNGCMREYKKTAEERSEDHRHVNCSICNQIIRMSYFSLRQGKIEEDQNARAEIKDGAKRAKELGRYDGPHTKTRALVQDLLMSKAESNLMPNEPPIKSVVFSGWTSHLDLIQMALDDNDIIYTRLDGKMSRAARTAAMDTFRTDPLITVILVSITAGGLGLNLTTANKVYVMEPQYNPAAEAQAVDRVHRLGQKREVQTVRYIMNNSFEEKMLELQEKKKKLASLSMDREGGRTALDKAEATRKRLEDLRSLFK